MTSGFFKELKHILGNEWIVVADACALFAGWCPLDKWTGGDFGKPDRNRRYKRIASGEEEVPSEDDFFEMEMFHDKYVYSDFQVETREPRIINGDDVSDVIRVQDAFKVGLGYSDERIDILYDAAVEAGIIAEAFQFIRRDHHHITVGAIGVTATGEVGDIKPKHYFDLGDEPKKLIVRLLYRFLKQERDARKPKPNARDFMLWVHATKPTEPFITIDGVGGGAVMYHENSARDEPKEYKRSTISVAISDLTKKKN